MTAIFKSILFIMEMAAGAILLTAHAHAKDLAHYRTIFQIPATEFTEELNGLKTKLLGLGALKDSPAFLRTLSKTATQVEHYASSSQFFKNRLLSVSEALRSDQESGRPTTFDPSLQHQQIDQLLQERIFAVCDKEMSKVNGGWPLLFKMLDAEVVKSTDERKAAEVARTPTPADQTLLEAVRASLGNILQPRSEAFPFEPSRLQRVEVIDGVITRLRFPELIDFNVLVSIRTQADPYFVQAIQCTHRALEQALASKAEWLSQIGGQDRAKRVLEFVASRRDGAVDLAKRLNALRIEEVDALIVWFGALRGDDLPTSTDLETLVERTTQDQSPETLRQMGLDLSFYQQWSNDADRLLVYLQEQKDKSRVQKDLLKQIREGK